MPSLPQDESGLPLGAVYRFPPARDVPLQDRSLLRLLYCRIRFLDTEWWWTTTSAVVRSRQGQTRQISMVSNVQLNGALFGKEPLPAAVVVLRDLSRKTTLLAQASGSFSDGDSCRFIADGLRLGRADPLSPAFDEEMWAMGLDPAIHAHARSQGLYFVRAQQQHFGVHLNLWGEAVCLPGTRGWVDFDPNGPVPLWGTSKLRLYRPSGSVHFGDPDDRWEIVSGSAHFEQQCLLPSATFPHFVGALLDISRLPFHLKALGELGFKWNYYTVRVKEGLITAFFLWSTQSGRILRQTALLVDEEGRAFEASGVRFESGEQYRCQDLLVPRRAIIWLSFSDGPQKGGSRLELDHDSSMNWFVPYPLAHGLICMAHEATCTGTFVGAEGVAEQVVANQETVDYQRSIVWKDFHV